MLLFSYWEKKHRCSFAAGQLSRDSVAENADRVLQLEQLDIRYSANIYLFISKCLHLCFFRFLLLHGLCSSKCSIGAAGSSDVSVVTEGFSQSGLQDFHYRCKAFHFLLRAL